MSQGCRDGEGAGDAGGPEYGGRDEAELSGPVARRLLHVVFAAMLLSVVAVAMARSFLR